jgi:hypothetical protein
LHRPTDDDTEVKHGPHADGCVGGDQPDDQQHLDVEATVDIESKK